MFDDLKMLFLVDTRQQDKADGAEQDKAEELAEPEQPPEGLTEGLAGYVVEFYGLLDEEGVDADAAGPGSPAEEGAAASARVWASSPSELSTSILALSPP